MNVKVLKSIQEEDRDKLKEQFALDLLKGFSENQKRLSSKYFYDAKGSELFSQIMDLEDYYPTECEIEIFEKNKNAFADIISGDKFNLIELGAGDGRKTRILIEAFLNNKSTLSIFRLIFLALLLKSCARLLKKSFPICHIQELWESIWMPSIGFAKTDRAAMWFCFWGQTLETLIRQMPWCFCVFCGVT